MNTFEFGGDVFIIKEKIMLQGMEYYQVLENSRTGSLIYLYCFPGI